MTKFQKNQENQQQEKQEQQNTSTNSTTTVYTDPGVFTHEVIKMQLERLTPLYEQLFQSSGIPWAIQQFFARLIRAGMEPGVIASAINDTAWARFPTPYYMRAILQRYLAEGVMTEAQLDHERQERADFHHGKNADREDWLYY